ncbi:MAG: hypothetical protein Q7J15_04110, partial [Candidatus Desulfaltia sp.]|nr:hypothetical protein [Candidatus Desulfaltia sp.]
MNKNIKVLLIVFCCFPHCQLFQVNNAGAGSFFEEKLYPQGKKFSFGIWSVKNLQEMKQVKKDGFNFIQCYGPGEGTEEEIKQWLEWAKDTELFVMFNMGGFRKQAVFNEDGRHMKSFARRFETYKNYENIAWWHIPEEQQIGDAYEGPMIKEYCKYLHENDPQNRPVYMYIAGNYTKDDLVPYVEHLDIIGAGGYTSLYEYPRPWILWRTGQDTAAIQKANISDRPKAVISFLQMFLEDQKLGLGFGKAPTFKDIYHDIYASIAAGAKGVIAYHLSYSYQVPGVYDAFKKAAGEITGSGGLGEVILSGKDFNKVKLKII